MPKKKENLINKLVKRNYESELEKVLENKNYDESVKSLLLNLLYKIEDSYKDYKRVKQDTDSKEEYISKIIEIVRDKCNQIELKEINDKNQLKQSKDKIKIDAKSNKIECYPIEKELLYGISMINRKENIVKNNLELINDSMTNLINVGRSIEFVEPLRDFNGWAWTTEEKEIENIQCNFVYQLMRMLVGNKFLLEWIKNKEGIIDYFDYFKNELESKYDENTIENIVEDIIKISILVDIKNDKKQKEKWLKLRNELSEELSKINDKKSYIQNLTEKKKSLNEQIKLIDQTINDKLKLKEEYKKRNEKLALNEKIFSIKILEKIMKEERNKLSMQIKECNKKLKPKNYFIQKNYLESKLKLLEVLDFEKWELKAEQCIDSLNINYQKCFKVKIRKAKTREELIKLLYEYRYYSTMLYNKKTINFDVPKTKSNLLETGRLLIQKCIANNIIVNLGTSKKIVLQLCEMIFNTRIIELENVYTVIEEKDEKYFVQVYDENVLDKNYELKKTKDVKFDDNRLNKKIKIII